MTDREALMALAERVEGLTHPSEYAAVAKSIYRALFTVPELGHPNGYGWREDDAGWWLATGEDARVPPKTIYPPKWLTSLDAAMTLVPERWAFTVGHWLGGDGNVTFFADCANIASVQAHDGYDPIESRAATPALALTAAALRARAA